MSIHAYRYSFIIATFGREDELKTLFGSLATQTYQDFEIIVVDQNEHERVHSICKKQERLTYIHSKHRGLSIARNLGIKQARGKYLVFPDDDAVLSSDFLENANTVIQRFAYISIFSGIVITLEKNKPFSRYMDFVPEEITYANFNKFMSTTMIIHNLLFDKLGGFDEEMGVGSLWGGSEETGFLLRAFEKGFKCYYSPTLMVYHPEANFSKMSFLCAAQKGYSYGLGRGAMFKKLIRSSKWRWMLYQWVLSILKTIAGVGDACIQNRWKDVVRHGGAFWGRIVGFIFAKTSRY